VSPFRRSSEHSGAPSPIADECAAFLTGEYAQTLLAAGYEVPPWAWLNSIAHGGESRLHAAIGDVRTRAVFRRRAEQWQTTVRRIALEILAAATTRGIPAARLQRDVLVPVEFALMARPTGPRAVLRATARALHDGRDTTALR
jgi:hypothetical protein